MPKNDYLQYIAAGIDKGFEGYQRGYDLELKKQAMEQDREMQRRAMKLKQAEELRNIMDSYKEIPPSVRSSGMFDKDVLDAYAPEPVGLVEAPAQGLMAEPQKPSKYPNLSPEAQQIIGGEPPQAPQVAKPQGGLVQQPGFLSKFERNKLDAAMKMQNFKLNELQQQKLEQDLAIAPIKRKTEQTKENLDIQTKQEALKAARASKIPGYDPDPNFEPSKDNEKVVQKANIGRAQYEKTLEKLEALIKGNTLWDLNTNADLREQVQKLVGKQELDMKIINDLGAIQGADVYLIKPQVINPLLDVGLTGVNIPKKKGTKYLEQISRAREDAKQNVDTIAEFSGYKPTKQSKSEKPPKTQAPPAIELQPGEVAIEYNGQSYAIPAEQLQEALKNGAKKL